MTFGKNLQAIRLSHGLSQEELAKLVGVRQVTISSWERGYREPNFEACEKLADALNVPLNSIMIPSDKSADDDLVRAVADSFHNDPKRRLLFSLQLNATPEDLDFVNTFLQRIAEERERR